MFWSTSNTRLGARSRVLGVALMAFVFVPTLGVADDGGARALRYLVGTGMTGEPFPGFGLQALCNWASVLGPTCPNESTAANGDTIKFQGEGILYVNRSGRPSRRITGGGSFTHVFASGGEVSGTWRAKRLLSFESFGPATAAPLPPSWTAGIARILVDLRADAGVANAGILEVVCRLPGDAAPDPTLPEGSRLEVVGVLDFDQTVFPRATLFIDLGELPDDDDDD